MTIQSSRLHLRQLVDELHSFEFARGKPGATAKTADLDALDALRRATACGSALLSGFVPLEDEPPRWPPPGRPPGEGPEGWLTELGRTAAEARSSLGAVLAELHDDVFAELAIRFVALVADLDDVVRYAVEGGVAPTIIGRRCPDDMIEHVYARRGDESVIIELRIGRPTRVRGLTTCPLTAWLEDEPLFRSASAHRTADAALRGALAAADTLFRAGQHDGSLSYGERGGPARYEPTGCARWHTSFPASDASSVVVVISSPIAASDGHGFNVEWRIFDVPDKEVAAGVSWAPAPFAAVVRALADTETSSVGRRE